MDVLSDEEDSAIAQIVQDDLATAETLEELDRTIKNHSLKTVDEVLAWYEDGLSDMDARMQVVFQEERVFQKIIDEVQDILTNNEEASFAQIERNERPVVFSETIDNSATSPNDQLKKALDNASLTQVLKIYSSLAFDERLKLTEHFANRFLKEIAKRLKLPQGSISRNELTKELNWFLSGNSEKVKNQMLRDTIEEIFGKHFN